MGDFVCVKNHRIQRYPVAASQTIEIGDPVGKDANGRVIIGTAALTALLGVSARAVTDSAADDEILVFDDPQAEFECQADNAAQVAQSEVGTTCDLIVDTGVFKANLDATATNVLRTVSIGEFNDPLRDDSTYGGSTLAGDWTPGWQSKNVVRVKIAVHLLDS
jgi:hypothetical protein